MASEQRTTGQDIVSRTRRPRAVAAGTESQREAAVRRLVELTAILARRCAQLQEALESRIVIEQAKGVLAERFQLEPDKAFDVLRRGARSHRVPLHDLARQVVSSQETPLEIAAQIDGVAVPAKR